MSVQVIWRWQCDLCTRTQVYTEDSMPWTDEMAPIPPGWDTEFAVPEKYRPYPGWNICDACPDCQKNPNWSKLRT